MLHAFCTGTRLRRSQGLQQIATIQACGNALRKKAALLVLKGQKAVGPVDQRLQARELEPGERNFGIKNDLGSFGLGMDRLQ
jgi:hypothetical protein